VKFTVILTFNDSAKSEVVAKTKRIETAELLSVQDFGKNVSSIQVWTHWGTKKATCVYCVEGGAK
jgi:hypothetical protein